MAAITLSGKMEGRIIFVDKEDYELLKNYTWWMSERGYAYTKINRQSIYMHKLIMNHVTYPKSIVDHKNRNRFDNRKSNLRVATHAQNIANSGPRTITGSKYKGVNFDKQTGKWRAKAIDKHLGRFDSEEEAAQAYDVAAFNNHGEFAYLNLGKK